MSLQIIEKDQQARGAFDFGKILENKPMGFPHEGGALKSTSNLFYWAHAWSDGGGLIDTHPHQGFEIMSYVLDGQISHYDTHYDRWLTLDAGDAQLIKSGKGISHAERFLPGGKIFQIWFDPDLNKAMRNDASYVDVKAKDFLHESENDTWVRKGIVGGNSPLKLDSEFVEINDYTIQEGQFSVPINKEKLHFAYLIKGQGTVSEKRLNKDDLLLLDGEDQMIINFETESQLFVISVPKQVSYTTYAQMQA